MAKYNKGAKAFGYYKEEFYSGSIINYVPAEDYVRKAEVSKDKQEKWTQNFPGWRDKPVYFIKRDINDDTIAVIEDQIYHAIEKKKNSWEDDRDGEGWKSGNNDLVGV